MSIYMPCEYGVIMTSALPFIAIFGQIRNKDVKVDPCSNLQLLKLPCFRSLSTSNYMVCRAITD